MTATLHNLRLGESNECREVVIIDGCKECIEAFHLKLCALIAEAKEEARKNPCGCKEGKA